MMKMSFIDKINILINIVSSSKKYALIFFILLLICYILTTKKNKAKHTKRIAFIIYTLIIGMILYNYRNNLSNMLDYMMNNLFIIIYFPNLAIYLAAIITTNIILLISVFNSKIPKFLRNINVSVYCTMMYFLVLILNIIKDNNLDVFTQSSVYGNQNAQALIELSSSVFVVWIMFLITYKTIKSIIVKPKNQLKETTNEVKEQVPPLKQTSVPVSVIEKPYRKIQAPYIAKTGNNTIKIEKIENPEIKKYDDLLTLDDYKLLLSILKEEKAKEQQAKERQARIDKEQEKYVELQKLYSNVM